MVQYQMEFELTKPGPVCYKCPLRGETNYYATSQVRNCDDEKITNCGKTLSSYGMKGSRKAFLAYFEDGSTSILTDTDEDET